MTIPRIKHYVENLYVDRYAITSPTEIDIEAIAFDRSATVLEGKLTGCEAMIIGAGDKATITVNEQSSPQRQRFSIGHELGHWFKDRGKVGNLCSKHDMDSPSGSGKQREVIANEYASELLLPTYLLTPILQKRPLDQSLLSEVVNLFDVSFMAALRRVIDSQYHMGFFAMYDSRGKRRLFKANKSLPYEFLPPQIAPEHSRVYELIHNGKESGYGLTDGEVWCKRDLTGLGVVHENAFHYHDDIYITLVWWEDDEPIWQFIQKEEIGE
ncbi:MAG TPA: hypothetical protein DCW74_18185 [Alteromonas australica]|uniref:IrrE N-terminal-like domain-containing protein n=1 Tax=Alteromonas australica TaxID=589873 RepID=A0A350P8N3_9ALTE|nr:ImmA/IrrE family metallo-endopeptidase [Alteromonas australica]MBU32636.1 hypothetical protein [Alteromonas sp.]MBU33025.1 hypothetical protein [Alteromonas sp.]HAW77650.1 hypothetical protein [Alteromonas australica]